MAIEGKKKKREGRSPPLLLPSLLFLLIPKDMIEVEMDGVKEYKKMRHNSVLKYRIIFDLS